MKKIIVPQQKLNRLCDLFKKIADKQTIIEALELETDIPPVAIQSSQTTWDKAGEKFLNVETSDPMEKAEFRRTTELISTELELTTTILYFNCIEGDGSKELTLLIRKATEII